MANARRYRVEVDGTVIYVGPIRSAQLIYDSIIASFKAMNGFPVGNPPVVNLIIER